MTPQWQKVPVSHVRSIIGHCHSLTDWLPILSGHFMRLVCLSIGLSITMSVCLFVCLTVYFSVPLSLAFIFISFVLSPSPVSSIFFVTFSSLNSESHNCFSAMSNISLYLPPSHSLSLISLPLLLSFLPHFSSFIPLSPSLFHPSFLSPFSKWTYLPPSVVLLLLFFPSSIPPSLSSLPLFSSLSSSDALQSFHPISPSSVSSPFLLSLPLFSLSTFHSLPPSLSLLSLLLFHPSSLSLTFPSSPPSLSRHSNLSPPPISPTE